MKLNVVGVQHEEQNESGGTAQDNERYNKYTRAKNMILKYKTGTAAATIDIFVLLILFKVKIFGSITIVITLATYTIVRMLCKFVSPNTTHTKLKHINNTTYIPSNSRRIWGVNPLRISRTA